MKIFLLLYLVFVLSSCGFLKPKESNNRSGRDNSSEKSDDANADGSGSVAQKQGPDTTRPTEESEGLPTYLVRSKDGKIEAFFPQGIDASYTSSLVNSNAFSNLNSPILGTPQKLSVFKSDVSPENHPDSIGQWYRLSMQVKTSDPNFASKLAVVIHTVSGTQQLILAEHLRIENKAQDTYVIHTVLDKVNATFAVSPIDITEVPPGYSIIHPTNEVSNISLKYQAKAVRFSWDPAPGTEKILFSYREGTLAPEDCLQGDFLPEEKLKSSSAELSNFVRNSLYSYRLCSASSGLPSSSGITGSFIPADLEAASLSCSTDFVFVPGDTGGMGLNAFCVMKYEAKILGLDNGNNGANSYNNLMVAESRATGTPWVHVNRDQAISECQSLGAGHNLISNAQWQALARGIEEARSESNELLNWNVEPAALAYINSGHSDAVPNWPIPAGEDPCSGTNNTNCKSKMSSDFKQNRVHKLANASEIWDLSGNVWEWVRDNPVRSLGKSGNVAEFIWPSPVDKENLGPRNDYFGIVGATSFGGLGWAYSTNANGAIIRGGGWSNGNRAGIFSSMITVLPSDQANNIGFRCVYENGE